MTTADTNRFLIKNSNQRLTVSGIMLRERERTDSNSVTQFGYSTFSPIMNETLIWVCISKRS